jgi:DtxR family transcriptional regulator, Mn-dependent transcriptional regulator
MTNHNHAWKEFKANEVSHSMAHYLVTLHDLHHERGYARVSDVAKELDVRKGTVSVQMRQLKEKGFVTEDENKFLQLTAAGETVARQVIYNRATIIQFLHKVLEIDREAAEVDACKIEHLLSPETGHQILALVQLLLSDDPSAKALLEKLKGMENIPEDIPELASPTIQPRASQPRPPAQGNQKTKVGDPR